MSRRIDIAPGITMDSSEMARTGVQVTVEHFAAGNAVLTYCTESKPGQPMKRFWEVETAFHDSAVQLHYRGPDGVLESLDEALAYLVLLGARWMHRHQDEAFTNVRRAMKR